MTLHLDPETASARLLEYLPDVSEGHADHSAETWPVAAAMLQAPKRDANGRTMAEAGPDAWHEVFARYAAEGFDGLEISSSWIDLDELSEARQDEFRQAAVDSGLALRGLLVASKSISGREAEENLRYSHTAIDVAARTGTPVVCLGLHEIDPRGSGDPLWFWTIDDAAPKLDMSKWDATVAGFQDLASHAQSVGVTLTLEMYPGTFLGGSRIAVDFLDAIGSDVVGLNPDLGNFIRVQAPVEEWAELAAATLPRTNYWHVKNYGRAENPQTGLVVTFPMPLESGAIDYRKAVGYAVESGFNGTIVTEHYGGDGVSVSAANRQYLRRVLPGGRRS